MRTITFEDIQKALAGISDRTERAVRDYRIEVSTYTSGCCDECYYSEIEAELIVTLNDGSTAKEWLLV